MMLKQEQGINDFRVYEDGTQYYGMAESTLPEISTKGDDITGAGIAGSVKGTYVGQIEAMTMNLSFRNPQPEAVKLSEPRNHQLDLRGARQVKNNQSGIIEQRPLKIVVIGFPTKFTPGKLAPASTSDTSVELAITYYAMWIDGKKLMEVDQFGFKYEVNGVDYLADVRKALGQ
ncbi:hypothetical protein FACS18949_02780 [Clostridia bacterium]|nr:hypothetical protein FACS18949_02780 [Clostridia bacterium]